MKWSYCNTCRAYTVTTHPKSPRQSSFSSSLSQTRKNSKVIMKCLALPAYIAYYSSGEEFYFLLHYIYMESCRGFVLKTSNVKITESNIDVYLQLYTHECRGQFVVLEFVRIHKINKIVHQATCWKVVFAQKCILLSETSMNTMHNK